MERLYLPTQLGDISYLERKGTFPVIFLHGLGGSGNNWLRLAGFLDERYRLLMPDLGGHGKTAAAMKDYSVAEQVAIIFAFIRELGLSRYALVGNSYGGWVSMRLCIAGAAPDYLVLIDSAGINPTVGEMSAEGKERFVERVMQMNPRNDREIIRKFVEQNATGTEKISDDELAALPPNTLIIWGSRDRLIPVEYARKLHSGISGSSLKILEDAGHIPHSTHPEKVGPLLQEFMGRVE